MRFRLLVVLASICSAVFVSAPAAAQDTTRNALEMLQRDDARLQTLGWKLATGNAPFCERAAPAIGLLLQDMAGYSRPDALREAAGIQGDIAVQAVAAHSPAWMAGLTPNSEVLAIGSFAMSALAPAERNDWRRLTDLHDLLDRELADGSVTLTWRDAEGTVRESELLGVPACRSRFELLDDGGRAAADGMRVVIGREFSGLSYAQEEFAAALAHELAHNVLRHREWLEQVGRRRENIRLSEREADRLAPWLLANAGFAPEAAARFMKRWGPRHDGGLLRKRTHDGWDERLEFIESELPSIRAALAAEGKADWSRLFRREIGD